MAKNKVYAVRRGKQTGLFYSWDECQGAINGYSGAEFRGFKTEEEASAYLRGESVGVSKTDGIVKIEKPAEGSVNIYTDGSFKDKNLAFGVFIEGAERDFSFCGVVNCYKYKSIANIASECIGALAGVQLARDMGFHNVTIIYDYKGIELWYDGTWGAHGELQSIYVSLMRSMHANFNMNYKFIDVAGHSSVDGNRRADALCRRAINTQSFVDINKILRGCLTVNDISLI